jgi:hypothetical protein
LVKEESIAKQLLVCMHLSLVIAFFVVLSSKFRTLLVYLC